ncbi:MAG: hypothetical protein ABI867_21330 [Kofleriaceae bacterium]
MQLRWFGVAIVACALATLPAAADSGSGSASLSQEPDIVHAVAQPPPTTETTGDNTLLAIKVIGGHVARARTTGRLALALALVIAKNFPSFGESGAVLVLSVVGVNQLIGPVLLRIACFAAARPARRNPLISPRRSCIV